MTCWGCNEWRCQMKIIVKSERWSCSLQWIISLLTCFEWRESADSSLKVTVKTLWRPRKMIHLKMLTILLWITLSTVMMLVEGARNSRVVRTRQGPVQGILLVPDSSNNILGDRAVEAYLGVPYAVPPVGNLRFMPPVSPRQWSYKDVRLETQQVVQSFTTWPCLPCLWR